MRNWMLGRWVSALLALGMIMVAGPFMGLASVSRGGAGAMLGLDLARAPRRAGGVTRWPWALLASILGGAGIYGLAPDSLYRAKYAKATVPASTTAYESAGKGGLLWTVQDEPFDANYATFTAELISELPVAGVAAFLATSGREGGPGRVLTSELVNSRRQRIRVDAPALGERLRILVIPADPAKPAGKSQDWGITVILPSTTAVAP